VTATPLQNWAGNYTYSAARLHYPKTIAQVQEVVARAQKLRVLGSRHSFNAIADSPEDMISLERLDPQVGFDHERRTVTISGGVRYGELALQLQDAGYALHNMASLPHISVAGACATATHGSGDGNGNLATAVSAMELVRADGQVVRLTRERDAGLFQGAVVSLGGLGVITRITLDLQPAFMVQQEVYENLPHEQLYQHFDAIMSSAYSVSLFTDWQNGRVNQVWLKRKLADRAALPLAPSFFRARLAAAEHHPITELPADPCTPQMGVPGAWHERLPHFRMDQTPSSGAELQSEYFVPRASAVAALQAVVALGEQIRPYLLISELRTIAADTLWMSPSYQSDRVGIHFTWKRDWPTVRELLPQIEASLAPFDVRPHWGKLFTLPAARVRASYARLAEFRQLLRSFDPQGKFSNPFLDTYIFGDG
jgi:xylitol oxidase